MSKTIDNIKCGNYEVVDNQGVSVTEHFIQCLEKEFADLEAKLAESEHRNEQLVDALNGEVFINYKLPMENAQLKQQLVDLQSEQIKEMQEHQEAMKLADKTIKDLEIKLLLKPSFGKFKSADELYKSYTNLGKEYTKSRQQLAEKEEFLKKQKELFETVDRELYLTKDTLKHHTNIYNSLVKSRNQDKISFAVEQLENCRLNLIKLLNKKLVYLDSSTADEMDDLFDNQIKLLKEGK